MYQINFTLVQIPDSDLFIVFALGMGLFIVSHPERERFPLLKMD